MYVCKSFMKHETGLVVVFGAKCDMLINSGFADLFITHGPFFDAPNRRPDAPHRKGLHYAP